MIHVSKAIEYVGIGSIVAFLMISTIPPPTNATEIIYDKNADLPICVYKEIKDCKTKSGLICEAETTIDPCQDIFHGFTGTDENYKPETNQFIVPNVYASDMNCEENPDHEYCNGEKGRIGYIYCDLIAPDVEDCYNRDYIQRDCDKNPENSRCTGLIGNDGLVFCDLDPDADPCYDRED
ncbi:MAG: hypothetical protein WBP83_04750 [Nitrososphaeraceae archaeon]|jgi:hypothetical protein